MTPARSFRLIEGESFSERANRLARQTPLPPSHTAACTKVNPAGLLTSGKPVGPKTELITSWVICEAACAAPAAVHTAAATRADPDPRKSLRDGRRPDTALLWHLEAGAEPFDKLFPSCRQVHLAPTTGAVENAIADPPKSPLGPTSVGQASTTEMIPPSQD
eukprot:CAMPEP_0184683894 /NCGR_PEP_ID=MMETSP0312-20130426/13045_1 /TAXON_ID=31354 /ORGANISM="Compsopogon coeruleus, Strain SAG 36.94" /LENGTH=161 /DNA_ID=CAMNT_0027136603 /DNA_START=554 /DNA_END=1038 /DNA_ORIENTATION=+